VDRLERLLSKAKNRVEGLEGNRALWDARTELLESFGRATCYEMVLPSEHPSWESLVRDQLPRLVHYLDTKHESIPGGHHVMISVWRGSSLHIFDGRLFWQTIAEIEGLEPNTLRRQILEGPRLLLGPGPAS
jgi:hypothetical protein